jgi:hypothetical protein
LPESNIHPTLCIDCLNDPQKIKIYIKQERLEWYAKQVKGLEKKIANDKALIVETKKDIPKKINAIHRLMELYKKIQLDEVVTGEDLTAELKE